MFRRVRLDPDQLEWIVREVVRRLREGPIPSPLPPGESNQARPTEVGRAQGGSYGREATGEGAPPKDAHIILTQTLITTATLEHKLNGVARLSVPPRAVVTPSARDLLKEHNIELVRTT
jgi:hypothetical protein